MTKNTEKKASVQKKIIMLKKNDIKYIKERKGERKLII